MSLDLLNAAFVKQPLKSRVAEKTMKELHILKNIFRADSAAKHLEGVMVLNITRELTLGNPLSSAIHAQNLLKRGVKEIFTKDIILEKDLFCADSVIKHLLSQLTGALTRRLSIKMRGGSSAPCA